MNKYSIALSIYILVVAIQIYEGQAPEAPKASIHYVSATATANSSISDTIINTVTDAEYQKPSRDIATPFFVQLPIRK